ncbi:hypothetical protein ADUPG1_003004, partial [Aduncisulcus paluster]
FSQYVAKPHEHCIPVGVSLGVIDLFKMINIKHDNAFAQIRLRRFHDVGKVGFVINACQRIDNCHFLKFFHQAGTLKKDADLRADNL